MLESEDELESEMPDTPSTQELQMKFDKNGKMEDEKQVSIQIPCHNLKRKNLTDMGGCRRGRLLGRSTVGVTWRDKEDR